MIDYQNITDNEIKRIVAGAADPAAQVSILADLTGKKAAYIKRAAGLALSEKETQEPDGERRGKAGPGKKKKRKYAWSETELRFLVDNPDMKNEDLHKALGRSVTAITVMRSKLGLRKNIGWSEEETNKLLRLLSEGRSWSAIAIEMGRTYGSIQGKLQQLQEKGVIIHVKKKKKS